MNRPPWLCPQCGRSLRVANQEHVCGQYDPEGHFEGKDPLNRIAFEWILDILDPLGHYDVLFMKTMIAFARGVNFAFLVTKRRGCEIHFVLSRSLESPRVSAFVTYSRAKTICKTRIASTDELDEELADWLREAYACV